MKIFYALFTVLCAGGLSGCVTDVPTPDQRNSTQLNTQPDSKNKKPLKTTFKSPPIQWDLHKQYSGYNVEIAYTYKAHIIITGENGDTRLFGSLFSRSKITAPAGIQTCVDEELGPQPDFQRSYTNLKSDLFKESVFSYRQRCVSGSGIIKLGENAKGTWWKSRGGGLTDMSHSVEWAISGGSCTAFSRNCIVRGDDSLAQPGDTIK